MKATFSSNYDANVSEIISVTRQPQSVRAGEKISAFGGEFEAQAYTARGSRIKGTLPAVVIPGMVDDGQGEVMIKVEIVACNPLRYPKQAGGFLARVKGRVFGIVMDGHFFPENSYVYSELL